MITQYTNCHYVKFSLMRSILLLSGSICFILSGCIKNNPDPSWLEIKDFTVVANPELTEGELSMHGFTNGWVYINEKFIGTFELPCKIPVLITGQASVRVYPTVIKNGIAASKKLYPFTAPYETTIELVQNETVTINPVTNYIEGTNLIIEDFQGGAVKLIPGNDTQTNLLIESEGGNSYGRVLLTSSAPYWSAYMNKGGDNEAFSFPIGSEIFLEFECNNTHRLKTSIIYGKLDGTITEQDNITVTTAKDGWKKMYIELTEVIAYSGGYAFWFGFKYELPEGESEATVLIDNIKIVYR